MPAGACASTPSEHHAAQRGFRRDDPSSPRSRQRGTHRKRIDTAPPLGPVDVAQISLADIPMELNLGTSTSESLSNEINQLAEFIDAGLFAGVPYYKNDSIENYLERCASTFADQYDIPVAIDFERDDKHVGAMSVGVMYDYVDVLNVADFFKDLLAVNKALTQALFHHFHQACNGWFDLFDAMSAYQIVSFRFEYGEWWEDLRQEVTREIHAEHPTRKKRSEATNAQVRAYIRNNAIPTRKTYMRRLGAALCRPRGGKLFSMKRCSEQIAGIASTSVRERAAAFYAAIKRLKNLSKTFQRLSPPLDYRDSKDEPEHADYHDDDYEQLPTFIIETSDDLNGVGYVSEIFNERDQDVMNSNGWGPNIYFQIHPNKKSVTRFHRLISLYAKAYALFETLKLSIGDHDT